MIYINGLNDKSAEYNAAEQLIEIASHSIPDLEKNTQVLLQIYPSVQCYGQKPQDVDLLVIFADYRNDNQLVINAHNQRVHSFITTIEVKDHPSQSVRFEGNQCYVSYNGKEHNASLQSEGQKYSVVNYIKKNNHYGHTSPYVKNMVWLRGVPSSQLPNIDNNCLGAEAEWNQFISLVGSPEYHEVKAFDSRGFLNIVSAIFEKKVIPTQLDRKKMEIISKKVFDIEQQQYAQKLGQQLLTFRGRGGTGKTVKLIRAAFQAYDELGMRVIILTYNKALVSDITRLLTLLGVKNSIGASGFMINTIHKFMKEWLSSLGILAKKSPDFLTKYEDYKLQALEYLKGGAIDTLDVQKCIADNSLNLDWDLLMIDESQDWPESERDLLYKIYGHKKIITADGVDQLVRSSDKIDWRQGIPKSEQQIVPLRKSLRLKSNLCKFVATFADEIEYENWNLEPQEDAHGGRVIIVTGNPFSIELHEELNTQAQQCGNLPIDSLYCVPPKWVTRCNEEGNAVSHSKLAAQFDQWNTPHWDAVDEELRGDYPQSRDQRRIVQYDSCRGLEGWAVINYAIDDFYEHKKSHPEFSSHEESDLYFNQEESAEEYAKRWVMIPLTRAIDTLVLHIQDESSFLGQALLNVQKRYPESIELRHYE